MAEIIRVVICDDHAMVRSGLRRIMEAEEGLEVVGEAGSVAEAVELAAEVVPDVVVMDLGLPDARGMSGITAVAGANPETRVLVLTFHDDVAYLRNAFAAGAIGYLLKEAADVELVQAVRQVATGRQYVYPILGAALLADNTPATPRLAGPGGELSEREMEVLRLVALGFTNAEIGDKLYVSVRTVETHRAHIYQKLNVRSRARLVRLAREAGLLEETGEGP